MIDEHHQSSDWTSNGEYQVTVSAIVFRFRFDGLGLVHLRQVHAVQKFLATTDFIKNKQTKK